MYLSFSGTTQEFLYSFDAFPRCNFLRKRKLKFDKYSELLKVRVLYEEVCAVNENDFAVETDVNEKKFGSDSDPGFSLLPCVNVCILQTGTQGNLSTMVGYFYQLIPKDLY